MARLIAPRTPGDGYIAWDHMASNLSALSSRNQLPLIDFNFQAKDLFLPVLIFSPQLRLLLCTT